MMVKPLIPEMVQAVPGREVRLLVQMELERIQVEVDLPAIPVGIQAALQAAEAEQHSQVVMREVMEETER
jgi:hypothetical protein